MEKVKNYAFWAGICAACSLLETGLETSYSEDVLQFALCSICVIVGIKGITKARARVMAKRIKHIGIKGAQVGKKKATEQLHLPLP
jgi:hypothetical protein